MYCIFPEAFFVLRHILWSQNSRIDNYLYSRHLILITFISQETSTLFAVTMVMRISSREARGGNLLLSDTLLDFRHFSKTGRNKVEFANWFAEWLADHSTGFKTNNKSTSQWQQCTCETVVFFFVVAVVIL